MSRVFLTTVMTEGPEGRTKDIKLKFDKEKSLDDLRRCIGLPKGWKIYGRSIISYDV